MIDGILRDLFKRNMQDTRPCVKSCDGVMRVIVKTRVSRRGRSFSMTKKWYCDVCGRERSYP